MILTSNFALFRQRLLDEETNSIRRELDALKTRIRKYAEKLMIEAIIIVNLDVC